MKKALTVITAFSAIAAIYATNPKMEISSPSLHLPNKYFGEIETNITVSWNREKPYYENDHEKMYDVFSAHVCNDGDCFTGIRIIDTEKTFCNIYGDCEKYNVSDLWITKDEDTFWLNLEIGF